MSLSRTLASRPRSLVWAVLLLPMLLGLWSVREVVRAYSPIPFQDYWATVAQYHDIVQRGLRFSDLFHQHNEHRILFPRLVFFADMAWFHGRSMLNFLAMGLIQLLAAAFYVKVSNPRALRPLGVLGLALAIALMFSLVQWENFFWAFQVQFVGVYLAGAWALYFFCRGTADSQIRWGELAAALGFLVLATFSMANGMLAGLAMVAVAVIARRKPQAAILALLATAVLMAIYLVGFQTEGDRASADIAKAHPWWVGVYLLAYLGNLWGVGVWKLAFVFGVVGMVGALAMAVVVYLDRGKDLARTTLLGVVIFIGLTGGMTSLGRLHLGVNLALSSRYTTPTAHFWAAQALFWALTFQDAPIRALRALGAAAVLIAGVLLVKIETWSAGWVAAPRERILLGGSALLSGLPDDAALKGIFPDSAFPLAQADFMRREHISVFAGPPAPRIGARLTAARVQDVKLCWGYLDAIAPDDGAPADWRAIGWSWDVRSHRPFERIVVVDESGAVVGDGLSGLPRADVPKALHDVKSPDSGWVAAIARGHGQLTAYGLLADGRACEIGRKAWPS